MKKIEFFFQKKKKNKNIKQIEIEFKKKKKQRNAKCNKTTT